MELVRVSTFLAAQSLSLSAEGLERFLDALKPEYSAALAALRRRSQGDYSPTKREAKFPDFKPKGLAGMTCWTVFEAWPDPSHSANGFKTERAPLAEVVSWIGD
ncbi:hypothetical protein [Bosea sp. (in: a-proteobacteria)]